MRAVSMMILSRKRTSAICKTLTLQLIGSLLEGCTLSRIKVVAVHVGLLQLVLPRKLCKRSRMMLHQKDFQSSRQSTAQKALAEVAG